MKQTNKPPYKSLIYLGIIIGLGFLLQFLSTPSTKKHDKIVEVVEEKTELPTNFDYVYKHFKVYNAEIDTETVILFNNVCTHYKLDTTKQLLDLCIGQILYESGAQQYYASNHPKEGELVQSYAGAIGIGQIMPNTAYGIISKLSPKDATGMLKLGCTPVYSIRYSESVRKYSEKWISNKRNNLIMWGYIMKTNLSKRPNIYKALVSYNSGTGGMIRFIKNGGDVYQHKYVRGIRNTLSVVDRSTNDHEKVS